MLAFLILSTKLVFSTAARLTGNYKSSLQQSLQLEMIPIIIQSITIQAKTAAVAPSIKTSVRALMKTELEVDTFKVITKEDEAKMPVVVCDQTPISPCTRMMKGSKFMTLIARFSFAGSLTE